MKKILLIAMVLIATTNTKAQEKKIKGRVVEQLQDGSWQVKWQPPLNLSSSGRGNEK